MSLTDFLLARVAQQEAALRDRRFHGDRSPELRRELAECEAKRRIVLQQESARTAENAENDEHTGAWAAAMAYAGELAMKDLATIYADHPDYRNEWRPDA